MCEVANWVETEQLVQIRDASSSAGGGWLSFVQVRGSVPVFWDQPSALSAVTITRLLSRLRNREKFLWLTGG